jgi:O-antigen/teichoic acid export membrane protein
MQSLFQSAMGGAGDFLYQTALSIVQHNGDGGKDTSRIRAHRAVIIMSYGLGLVLSSVALYVLSFIAGTSELSVPVFALTFVLGLILPYFINLHIYIKNRRFEQIAVDDNIPKSRFFFFLLYPAAHVLFMLIAYCAGQIGRH